MSNSSNQSENYLEQLPKYQPQANEAYMNQAQLDHFRNKLLEWKKVIMKDVDSTLQSMKKGQEHPNDTLDRASQEEVQSLELRTRNREFKLIRKIDEALKRIDVGGYGYCLETGDEIGLARLEARPTSELCIEAKRLREAQENAHKR